MIGKEEMANVLVGLDKLSDIRQLTLPDIAAEYGVDWEDLRHVALQRALRGIAVNTGQLEEWFASGEPLKLPNGLDEEAAIQIATLVWMDAFITGLTLGRKVSAPTVPDGEVRLGATRRSTNADER